MDSAGKKTGNQEENGKRKKEKLCKHTIAVKRRESDAMDAYTVCEHMYTFTHTRHSVGLTTKERERETQTETKRTNKNTFTQTKGVEQHDSKSNHKNPERQ